MGNTFYFDFEPILIEWIQNMLGEVGVFIASLFTMFGEQIVLVVALTFLYWCYDKEFAKRVGINIVVGIVGNAYLKNIFVRRRPYFDHENIKCLKAVSDEGDIYDVAAQGFSFPSGHSMNSAIIYWSLLYKRHEKAFKALRVVLFIIPLLVGLSRIALGVHYPTDVLAGWLIGGAIVLFMPYLESKVNKRWVLYLIIFLISATGIFFCKTDDYFTSLGVMIGFFLGVPFEERFVNFKNTKSIPKIALRLAGGIIIYLALNVLLKLPFDAAFLASPVLPAFLIRTARYAIIIFVIIAIYPMAFDKITFGNK